MPSHLFDVVRCGLLQSPPSGGGEPREAPSPVRRAARALDESSFDQSVETSCQSARGEQQPVGELAHAQHPPFGLRQLNEDPVVGDGHLLGLLELGVEVGQEPPERREKGAPGTLLQLVEQVDLFNVDAQGSG